MEGRYAPKRKAARIRDKRPFIGKTCDDAAEKLQSCPTGVLQIVAFPGAEHNRSDSSLVLGIVLVLSARGKAWIDHESRLRP